MESPTLKAAGAAILCSWIGQRIAQHHDFAVSDLASLALLSPSPQLAAAAESLHTYFVLATQFAPADVLIVVAVTALFVLAHALWRLARFLFKEDYIYRPLGTVEASEDVLHSIAQHAAPEIALHGREAGTIPPPYPNSWFRVMLSRDLPVGRVVHLEALGQQLALYRGQDGVAYIVDAYCPHLGANLAVGGTVEGANIVCPFHQWKFRGQDGACAHIPYAASTDGRAPEFARIGCWHVCEVNDLIHLWYDAEKRAPSWTPPSLKEMSGGANFILHGHSLHYIRAHIQEMPENGADTAHLNALHESFIFRPLASLFSHYWEASWDAQPAPNEHLALINVKQHVRFLGREVSPLFLDVKIFQAGPGLVYLNFATIFGRMAISETVLPQGPLMQDVRHFLWAERTVPRFVAKLVFRGMLAQFERDVPIWNHKTYLPRPLLIKDDGPIGKYRRWFSRFYSENSVRFVQPASVPQKNTEQVDPKAQ